MSQLAAFYDRYHQKNHRFSKVISRRNFTYWYILDFLHQACRDGFSGLKVLDVGCGVGSISLYLASQGARVTGIDISPRAIAIANQAKKDTDLRTVAFRQSALRAEPRAYDLIVCFEVIEHIKNDGAFVKQLCANLKSKGLLVLSTPSKDNLLYRLGWYARFDTEVGHLRRYTPADIDALLSSHGFTVLKVRSVEGPLRNLLFTTKLGFMIKAIRGPLIPIFHWFDHLSGMIFGFSDIQVVAQKTK